MRDRRESLALGLWEYIHPLENSFLIECVEKTAPRVSNPILLEGSGAILMTQRKHTSTPLSCSDDDTSSRSKSNCSSGNRIGSGLDSGVHGYKFVGDSIDKTIRPRPQQQEKGAVSLHYFQGFAVRDRVDISQLSDLRPTPDPTMFLPS